MGNAGHCTCGCGYLHGLRRADLQGSEEETQQKAVGSHIFRVVLSVLIAAADSGSACRAAGIHRAALDINIASDAALTAADPCALRNGSRRQLAGIHINPLADAALTAADTRTVYAAGRKNLTAIDIRRQRAEMKVRRVPARIS